MSRCSTVGIFLLRKNLYTGFISHYQLFSKITHLDNELNYFMTISTVTIHLHHANRPKTKNVRKFQNCFPDPSVCIILLNLYLIRT